MMGEIISEWWATSNRNGGRDHSGTVGDIERNQQVTVRIRKHEAVPQCGSYEVAFDDGRPSAYLYWDDIASRRLRPEMLTGAEALEQARALARAKRDGVRLPPASAAEGESA